MNNNLPLDTIMYPNSLPTLNEHSIFGVVVSVYLFPCVSLRVVVVVVVVVEEDLFIFNDSI
jgi:hypothetical protein